MAEGVCLGPIQSKNPYGYNYADLVCEEPAKPAKRKVIVSANIITGQPGSGFLAGCSGDSQVETNKCGATTVEIVGPTGKSQTSYQSRLDVLVQSGKAKIETVLTIPAGMVTGDLSFSLYSQNGAITADGEGNLSITANPASACTDTTQIRSCTPYAGVPGLVPVGVPKINKTNGKRVMQKAEDHNVYAVRAEMRDTTYGNPVFVTKVRGKTVNVGFTTTGEGDNQKTVWFEVNPDGSIKKMYDEVDNATLNSMTTLPQAMAYYLTDSEGNYQEIEAGIPKPRPDLESVEFRIVARENIPFEQLLLGNESRDFRGLVVTENSEKPIDLEQVKQYAKDLRVTIEVSASGKVINTPQAVALADIASAVKTSLPVTKSLYEGGQSPAFTIKISAELGDMGDQFLADYVWALVFGAKAEDSGKCK